MDRKYSIEQYSDEKDTLVVTIQNPPDNSKTAEKNVIIS